jgi:hypothetical protein
LPQPESAVLATLFTFRLASLLVRVSDTLQKVTGVWRGTFSYDPTEGVTNVVPVSFTLTLQQGWFGRFAGTVTEEGPGAMPGTGKIKGHYSFPRIDFRKSMPVCYLMTPDGGSVTFREWVTSQGYKCTRDIAHALIRYSGKFVNTSRAEGTWIGAAHQLACDEAAFDFPQITGSWHAEKVS